MSAKTTKIYLLSFLLCGLMSCSEDEPNVSSEPTLDLSATILSLPSETFTITGLISDPAGISSIQLIYEPWFLNKTINVDAGKTQFELNYQFEVPDTEISGTAHTIEVIVTNPGGKQTSSQVQVSLTDDIIAPQISFATPNDGGTYIAGAGSEFNLSFDVTDDSEIVSIRVIGMGINETIDVNATSYSFSQDVDFAILGAQTVRVIAVDAFGNETEISLAVNIEESLKFQRMYLADVDEAGLGTDLFGVPMRISNIDHPDSLGLFFRAYYYNKAANTEIRFIPQRGSFGPFSFGAGANAGELALGTDDTVAPIILPDEGYYNILVNLSKMEYTMKKYTPSDATFSLVQLMGTGVEVDGESSCVNNSDSSEQCWHFASGKELTVDPSNPYLFSATVRLFDHDPAGDGNNGFILGANPAGWAPFWRFDDSSEPEAMLPGAGDGFVFGSESYGTYTIEVDTHLNRAKVVPSNN